MEIVGPLFQAIVAGLVASALWSWTENGWGLRGYFGHAGVFALIVYVGLVGPLVVG